MRWLLALLFTITASAQVVRGPIFVNPETGGASTLNDGLIAYWKLDEASGTRADSEPTGTAQDLTDNNTVASAAGKIGNAADFEVNNDEWLSIADNSDLSAGDISFTIAVWVRLESKGDDGRVIVGKYSTVSNQLEYLLWHVTGSDRFVFQVSPGGTTAGVSSVTANNFGSPLTGEFYFIVAWHDAESDQLAISVNNGTPNTTSHSSGVFDGASQFQLGANMGLWHWDGLIDEVGFWKRVLTDQERTQLYNSGSGKTCCPF